MPYCELTPAEKPRSLFDLLGDISARFVALVDVRLKLEGVKDKVTFKIALVDGGDNLQVLGYKGVDNKLEPFEQASTVCFKTYESPSPGRPRWHCNPVNLQFSQSPGIALMYLGTEFFLRHFTEPEEWVVRPKPLGTTIFTLARQTDKCSLD